MAMYAIDGGPGVGKTTLVRKLRECGFDVIPEAAEILIKESNMTGSDCHPQRNNLKFQNRVFDLQLELEESSRHKDLVFCDRGILGGLAFLKLYEKIPSAMYEQIGYGRYSAVFIPEPLPRYENTDIRHEDEATARWLHEEIKDSYRRFGYETIELPPCTPEERLDLVIYHIRKRGDFPETFSGKIKLPSRNKKIRA